ncbi:MAG TPA: FAD-dependent oxidoreductase, partial [Pyrinomonadaceae bacterium]
GIAESAAHSLIATKPVFELCRDLGVELVEPHKESNARYIVRNGGLRRFPLSVPEALSTLGRAAFVRSNNGNGQSLESWGRHHLGQPAVDYLLTPFVRGIYGAQPAELGVAAAFPSLKVPIGDTLLGAMLKKRFKGPKGPKELKKRVAPKHGMGSLVNQLERHLQVRLGSRFRKGVAVRWLPDAPNIIVATPAYAAASLLELDSPWLAQQLLTVRYTPIVSVTVFVDRRGFTRQVEGVGALMPSCENRRCLGILFNSSSFDERVTDQDKLASFTVMMGGTNRSDWLAANDEQIEDAVRQELKELLKIQDTLDMVIHRWPAALPQYGLHLPSIWKEARGSWCATPGRVLFGNYTGQISLRGMIESAAEIG